MASRERQPPPGGGVVWHERLYVFECLGCEDTVSVRRAVYSNPEALLEMRELLTLDHLNCWKYATPELARNARRYRKESTRRRLLSGGINGMGTNR